MENSREERPILPVNAKKQKGGCLENLCSWFEDDYDDSLEDSELHRQRITAVDAVFLLINTMVGAGVLQQALAFEYSGIVGASFLFVIIGYFTYLGAIVLSALADASGLIEYPDIAYRAYGKYGALSVDISIVVFNFTTIITYVIYMGSLMNDIFTSYFPDSTSWYISEAFFSMLLTILVALPICMVRSFGRLTVVAYLSIFLMILVSLILCVDKAVVGTASDTGEIVLFSFSGSLMSLGNLVYSLGFSPAVLFTYHALDDQHKKSMPNVVLGSVLGGTSICFLIGLSGYLLFGDSTDANILLNLTGTLARICDLAMVVHFTLFLPGDFFILRASVYNLLCEYIFEHGRFYHSTNTASPPTISSSEPSPVADDLALADSDNSPLIGRNIPVFPRDRLENLDTSTYIVFTSVCLLSIMFAGILIEKYVSISGNFVINFIGGLVGSLDTFIIPGFCGLHYFKPGSWYHTSSYALIGFGCVCSIGIVAGSFLYLL